MKKKRYVGPTLKKKKKSSSKEEAAEEADEDFFFFFFSENPLFWFFSDLRFSTGQNWSEQKVKLIHALRATHGYQNIGVSSNSTRYGFSICIVDV